MELVCTHGVIGHRAVLHVGGEIDLATLPLFRDHLTRLVDSHPGSVVVVDLDGVTALDDTGLGMLLGAAGRARQLGGDLAVVSSGERLNARFALTRLDQAISVQPRI